MRRGVPTAAALALLMTPIWYAVVPSAARRFHVLDSVARNKPYRNDYQYVFTPWSVVERSADIYTSRVSNFLYATPFAYLRAGRGSMPHDPTLPQSAPLD